MVYEVAEVSSAALADVQCRFQAGLNVGDVDGVWTSWSAAA